MIDQNNLIPEEMSKKLEDTVNSALEAVSDIKQDLTEELSDYIDEIFAAERIEENCQITEEDMLRIVMEVIRPGLKKMAFDERNRVCDEMAESIKKAGFHSCGRIAAGRSQKQVKVDPRELGWRIMEKRNPHYKGQDQ